MNYKGLVHSIRERERERERERDKGFRGLGQAIFRGV